MPVSAAMRHSSFGARPGYVSVTGRLRTAADSRKRRFPTAGDLGKQFRVRGDVLFDGLRGLTGNLFDVVGGAVVAVLAVQTHHRGDVLLNKVG